MFAEDTCRARASPRTLRRDAMDPALLNGIVRIQAGDSRGTGFVVRVERAVPKLGSVEILTALHVVADLDKSYDGQPPTWHDGGNATVRFKDGREVNLVLDDQTKHCVKDDWALLRFEGAVPSGVVALDLACLERRNHARSWSTFGYGDAQPETGEPHTGKVVLDDVDFIHLYDDQAAAGTGGFLAGFSGAPCVCEGHVVGILIDALKKKGGKSAHGAVYALPIQKVVDACGLKLLPAQVPFEVEVDAALSHVNGESLAKLADELGVPRMEDETARRLWTARAVLAKDNATVCNALARCGCLMTMPEGAAMAVAEMALARAVHEEGARALQRCFKDGTPRGVATVASEKVTARLMLARALETHQEMDYRFSYVNSAERSSEAWAARIRDLLLGWLGHSPMDLAKNEPLGDQIEDMGGLLIAFPFYGHMSPLDEIERYKKVRPLAMLSPQHGPTFSRNGYEIVRALVDGSREKDIKTAHANASHRFARKR